MVLQESTILQGRYNIQRVLGEAGPIDITYLATDNQDDKDVIIREYFPIALAEREENDSCKALEPDAYAYGLAEYELEGNALQRLAHPNITPCTDQFNENETIYRVSERLIGISLRAYLRQSGGKVSEDAALDLIWPIMEGLESGHQFGLVHGSLSETSVFFDRGKTPKLFNFHAARLFTAQLTGNIKEVRVKGFSPPEIKSDREQIGSWSDVYSVAALIYYMMTGRALPTVIYPSHHERLL
ncbi:MAG: protein kinase, partial [Rhodothermaceae bacterium]|nr:protein kinase [Rhodothermaceae bacterium]